MITFCPPRRFQVFGMKRGMASSSSWQFLRATFARDFICFFHTQLFDQGLHPHPARNLTYMPLGQSKVNPLDQQPHDPCRLSGKRFILQWIESFQHFPHLSLQNVPLGLPRRLSRGTTISSACSKPPVNQWPGFQFCRRQPKNWTASVATT
jgi:hypothetical protein